MEPNNVVLIPPVALVSKSPMYEITTMLTQNKLELINHILRLLMWEWVRIQY